MRTKLLKIRMEKEARNIQLEGEDGKILLDNCNIFNMQKLAYKKKDPDRIIFMEDVMYEITSNLGGSLEEVIIRQIGMASKSTGIIIWELLSKTKEMEVSPTLALLIGQKYKVQIYLEIIPEAFTNNSPGIQNNEYCEMTVQELEAEKSNLIENELYELAREVQDILDKRTESNN